MKRENFRIVPKYYSTNSLTYILYGDKVVGFVEIFKNNFYEEVEPDEWKSMKKKRTPSEISADCEAVIKKLIENSKTNEKAI